MTKIDYTHIFEDSLNEIYVFNADTMCFIEVNRGARENLGYTMEELHTLTPLDLKREYTPQTFDELIAPLRDGKHEKIIFETAHYRKNGTSYPVEVHLHLSNIEDKQVFVAIILDITERIKAKQHALQLALEQEQMRLLREFINDVSHDLRTPLTQVGTSLYLLSRHTQEPQHQNYIRRAQDSLSKVGGIIDSMLQMSALDLQDNYEMKPINLNTLLEEIVDANETMASHQELSLQFMPAAVDAPFVIADPYYLMRSIENILLNALVYTNPGGEVTIQTSIEASNVRVSISDTGIGIAPEHLPHIFKRFYRGDPARGGIAGSGLGLSIAKKIIDKHQGTIDVETALGKGTVVSVNLPIASQQRHPKAESTYVTEVAPKPD